MAFTTRLALIQQTIKENPLCELIICERSLEADKNVFARMLFMEGSIEDVDYQIYHHLYNSTALFYKVDAIVYVDTEPAICHNRIHVRNREGEEGIPLEYLKRCRNYYHDWLIYGTSAGGKSNIHELSDNVPFIPFEENKEIKNLVFKQILTERENVPIVLHLNGNQSIDYDKCEGDHWIHKIMEFIQHIVVYSRFSK